MLLSCGVAALLVEGKQCRSSDYITHKQLEQSLERYRGATVPRLFGRLCLVLCLIVTLSIGQDVEVVRALY